MLKPETRQRLQALVQHPDFARISVDILDRKMFHAIDEGKPDFSNDVNIHTEGESSLELLISLVPEIVISEREPNRIEQSDHISVGEYARGTLEGATVSYWSTFYKMPKEKPSASTESIREISHLDCTINLAKVESLMEPWTMEEIMRNEG